MADQMFPNSRINNPYALAQVGPDAVAQQYKMQMQQRLADMLMMNGQQQPQGQMVSGHYVAPSPLQYLSGLANTGLGVAAYNEIPNQQAQYAQALRDQAKNEALRLTGAAPMTDPQANSAALANGGGPTVANAQTAQSYMSGANAPLSGIAPNVVQDILINGGPQQLAEFIRGVNMPTDRLKTERSYGIGANQGRQMYLDEQRAKSYIAPVKGGPGDIFFDPLNPTKQLVSIPQNGIQTNISPTGAATASPVGNYSNIVTKQESDKATANSYGTEIGSSAAKADKVLYDSAQNAQKQVDNANRIIDLVDGGALTGTGAEAALQLAKALNVVGVDTKDTIKKTELLFAATAQTTLDSIQSSGLGAGQGFTDKDRQFLERAKGGSITLDATTLKELARLQKLAAQGSVEAFNKRYNEMPESSRVTGWKPVEIKNQYSRSELMQELKRRQQNGAQ